ncbi:N-acetylmuramic acid 6-phosphate etherase [Cyanobacterium sp. Dongsha4]|uniref:N-acetylmuramic acid 6-phosphate etherase n=1 Tax=Cyanobacterium sp. DS4 TaxID=2878255 RepID=UPI002E7FB627|nr:N-acetylmuramic acid 6-phosphate etherase [Cyanobacterium sp. Dongsha4]WVK99218.1 N-acetylmuramic acid 6-phosphate etherase [Cyanobacterium sp. Dongsha4]
MNRGHLLTEQINQASVNLDQLSPLEIVDLFNQEDQKTLDAIASSRQEIAQTIEITAQQLGKGGRLFYIGAGTSGRLGVLDAAECPPTFCTPPTMVQGILAGGKEALVKSSEALEDRQEDGAKAMIDHNIGNLDVVIGITAGGTTPYVHGALQEAKKRGAIAVAISCVPKEQVSIPADIDIRLLTGAEILAGSTRLKAGTVTKMALNIISTGVMVQLGKVYGNRMIDVSVTNSKLEDRALRIISDLTGLDREKAQNLLSASGSKVKLALLMYWTNTSKAEAETLLAQNNGNLRQAINN